MVLVSKVADFAYGKHKVMYVVVYLSFYSNSKRTGQCQEEVYSKKLSKEGENIQEYTEETKFVLMVVCFFYIQPIGKATKVELFKMIRKASKYFFKRQSHLTFIMSVKT